MHMQLYEDVFVEIDLSHAKWKFYEIAHPELYYKTEEEEQDISGKRTEGNAISSF